MYYFASDIHLGLSLGDSPDSQTRFLQWLDAVEGDAEAIFLVGDVFDFWFEYKRVVPKGFVRVLAKFAELTSRGTQIHFFPGNHDMWVDDYLTTECGLTIHRDGEFFELCGKTLYVAHGDNLPTRDIRLKFLQRTFRSRTMRRIFSTLVHPDCAMRFGQRWSLHSRTSRRDAYVFGEETEPSVVFAREVLQSRRVDYFVFGHFHCPISYRLSDVSTLYILGGWVESPQPVYGVLDTTGFRLTKFVANE